MCIYVHNKYYENLVDLTTGVKVSIGDTTYDMSDPDDKAELDEYGTLTIVEALKFNSSNPTQSTYKLKFTPKNTTNYSSETYSGKISLEIVAYLNPTESIVPSTYDEEDGVVIMAVGSHTIVLKSGTPYGTIESALAAPTVAGGNRIWVVPNSSGNVIIKESVTIKSGVYLILPYTEGSTIHKSLIEPIAGTASDGSICYKATGATVAGESSCTTKVKLASNVTITLKEGATMEIAGKLLGGSGGAVYCGQTGGAHARLYMEDGSHIYVESGASLISTGYIIDNSSSTSPSGIDVYSGAKLYQPMVLRDFKGGSMTAAIYNHISSKHSAPFNQFIFMNVQTKVRVQSGAGVYNYANIAAGSQFNSALAHMVGTYNDGTSFIQLANGAYLDFKYNPETNVIDMQFYGGARTETFTVTVYNEGEKITASSTMFVFPISWMYNIGLNPIDENTEAKYVMGNSFKLLPGSSFTVSEGAHLTVKELSVYDNTFTDTIGVSPYPTVYPDSTSLKSQYTDGKIPSATLTVNGTLFATSLGGNIYSTNPNGATVKTNVVTVKTYEHTGETATVLLLGNSQTITRTAKLFYGSNAEVAHAGSGKIFYTKNGVWVQAPYFEFTVGEGYSIKTKDTIQSVAEDGTITYKDRNTEVAYTSGQTVLLPSSASVTYVLPANHYVLVNGYEEINYSDYSGKYNTADNHTQEVTISSQIEPVALPKITLEGSYLSSISEKKVILNDNYDGTVTAKVYLYDSADYRDCGEFTATVNYTDADGNEVTENAVVNHSVAQTTQTIFGRPVTIIVSSECVSTIDIKGNDTTITVAEK